MDLDAVLADAAAGRGGVVLLSGPAGIGKTSVLRAFLRCAGGRARLFVGACDDLLAPRAFGPFHDMAGPLAEALGGTDREAVFAAVLGAMAEPPAPTVLAVEDAHWADEPTLDVLRHVGRRVADLAAVLRRPLQLRHRGTARAVGADGRPPRVRRVAEARRRHPPRGGRGGAPLGGTAEASHDDSALAGE